MVSKSQLAIQLSGLKVFESPKLQGEQYATDSEIAAELLWNAALLGDIKGKVIADLGCGTGILGIGCLLLGAKRVIFVDNDDSALEILKENLAATSHSNYEVIAEGIEKLNLTADVVIMNPPFGTKQKHADRGFLLKAFAVAKVIYSFHKAATSDFVTKLSSDNDFRVTNIYRFSFPIKRAHEFHKRRIQRIDVAAFRLQS